MNKIVTRSIPGSFIHCKLHADKENFFALLLQNFILSLNSFSNENINRRNILKNHKKDGHVTNLLINYSPSSSSTPRYFCHYRREITLGQNPQASPEISLD